MLDRKNKNMILPYGELITKILEYFGFNLDKEKLEIKHSKIGKCTLSQMRYDIQGKEIITLPLKEPSRARQQQVNNYLAPSSSNILSDIHEDQKSINSKFGKLIKKLEKSTLISPMVFSEDDDDEMN